MLSAKQMGAERIMAMSRHESRQKLAREFGATDIVTERGDEGVARIMDLTNGIGADSVLECVGTQESMMQAIHCDPQGRLRHPMSAFRTGSSWTARNCFSPTSTSTAARPRCAATCQADRPYMEQEDQPRQGLRPDPAV